MNIAVRNFDVPVRRLGADAAGLRIAHVSDLHIRRRGRIWQRLQESLLAVNADLVAFTGDFCDRPWGWPLAAEVSKQIFEPVRPRYGLFAVLGNHDPDELADSLAATHMHILRDEVAPVLAGDATLNLAGIEQSEPGLGDVAKCLCTADPDRPTIMLAHYPSAVHFLPPGAVDLLLAGHTHGGQWLFPWLGCVWPHDWVSRHHVRGLHRLDATYLHVSAGIGVTAPLYCRFNCPAEITVLTLLPM